MNRVMKCDKVIICCIGVLLIFLLNNCRDNIMSNTKEYATKIPDFGAPPSESMSKGVDHVVDTYHEMVAEVMSQLSQDNLSNEGKVYAIYLLGQLRATKSVPILIENIDLVAPRVDTKGAIGRWGMYPAQEALSKIGKPAVNMIVDMLPDEKNELRRKLMCFVLADVDGAEVAKFNLSRALATESEPVRKGNLQSAQMILEGLPK